MGSPNRPRRRSGAPRLPPTVRPPYRYNRQVKDAEFVQRVRQHAPSSLLPLVARYGAEYAIPKKYQTARTAVYAPWVLADVARVSLVRGTEFRSKQATDDDLVSCCAAYQALSDPELGRKTPGGARALPPPDGRSAAGLPEFVRQRPVADGGAA